MNNELLQADSLCIMANMLDESVDVVITDPPYPSGAGLFKDSLIDGIAGLYLAAKKAKRHVLFFWSPLYEPPRAPPGWYHTSTHIWEKPDCKTNIRYEQIIVWSKEYKRDPYKVWTVHILDYRSLKDWKQHPTQKPLRLLRFLVEDYTIPGDLVMDPFAGTGTTGVACKQAGRNYLLIEKNAEYAAFAQERLATPAPRETQETLDTTKPPNEPQEANNPDDKPERVDSKNRPAQKRKK
jgi:DNA modification methylase